MTERKDPEIAAARERMAGPGLVVRAAEPPELPACADLYQRVLRETFTWMAPERHRAEDFLRDARDEEVYVATVDGRLAGIGALYRPQNFIHSLYVDLRGRGVGKALLAHLEAVAGGPVSLKVQVPNTRAQAFYLREGLRVTEQGRDPGSDVAWLRMSR
jgi:GNAT superfamily N-acetyltransferase